MIWCRFQAGETISHGMVEDETVIEVSGIPWGEHDQNWEYPQGWMM